MITIECVAFLGGEPNIKPKVLTTGGAVFAWDNAKGWYQMVGVDVHDFKYWERHAAYGRLIIRGKLRIKI